VKVLLINPTRTGFDTYVNPPLHLIYIAQAIEESGHNSQIIDVHYDLMKTLKNIAEKQEFEISKIKAIIEMDFDILGIGSIVSAFDFTKKLVNALHRKRPNIPVIIGGGMSMALKDLWLSKTQVNYLVESDGEVVIQKFLSAYPNEESLSKIPGLYVRKNDKFITNKSELPKNLDYISPPNWELLANRENYMSILKNWLNVILPKEMQLHDNEHILPIVMTRGCPYKCTFCYHVNNLHRCHSVGYIVEYLKKLKNKYGVSHIFTWDDLIMVDRKWLSDLCDELIKQDVGTKIYTSGGKPNLVTRDLLKKMKSAGFVRISYGIESGSQHILNVMNKRTTVKQNYDAVKMSMEEGIFTHLNMILGMPGESLTTLKETINFLTSLAKEGLISSRNISFAYATGYPGTKLFQHMLDNNIVNDPEEYLKNQTGVVEYKYNLCGINIIFLNASKYVAFAKVDFNYYAHFNNYSKALTSLLYRFLQMLFGLLPRGIKEYMRTLYNRKKLGM